MTDGRDSVWTVPALLKAQLEEYCQTQEKRPWGSSPRTGDLGAPPWPTLGNPMLEYLIMAATEDATQVGLKAAILQLATHAWMEGHIEGYDRAKAELWRGGPFYASSNREIGKVKRQRPKRTSVSSEVEVDRP